MHGFISGSNLLINAEVDSMGGIVESGLGIGTKTSPRRAAIEKAQVELRLEYDVREERRRELEFLEKGGNPLDFKFGVTAPVSVQSSSLADQLHGRFGTCEAKGSFALAASPQGDSIGSSGRLGASVACEPNSADNFDGENELIESKGKPTYASRSNITPSEHSSQLDGSQNVRESEDSPIFQPKRAYRRRNRSKTNRDTARSSSTFIGSRGGYNSSLSIPHGLVSKAVVHEAPCETEIDGVNAATANPTNGGLFECKLDLSSSKHMHDDPDNQDLNKDGVSTAMPSGERDPLIGREQITTSVSEFPTCSAAEKAENGDGLEQLRESDALKEDGNCTQTEGVVSSIAVALKGFDSESSCTQTRVSVDGNGNIDSGLCTSLKNVDSSGDQISQKVPLVPTENSKDEKVVKDRNVADIAESDPCINDSRFSQNRQANGFPDKDEEETNKNPLSAEYEAKCMPCAEEIQPNQQTDSTLVTKQGSLDYSINKVESSCPENPQGPHNPYNPSVEDFTKTDISCSVSELQPCDEGQTKVVDKAHEDRILEEARNIKANRKIIEELSLHSLPKEYRRKSHWDFVLEEMTWMANDFAQERIWKRTAATQLCYWAAFACRLRLEEQEKQRRDKVVAKTMAKAVTDFWHSAALLVGENGIYSGLETCEHGTAASDNTNGNNNAKVGDGSHDKEYLGKNIKLAVQGYAVRFLQHNSSVVPIVKDACSETLESVPIMDLTEMTYLNQHTEEDIIYAVAPGAMEAYRKSIERYMVLCERAGKNMLEEVDTSMYDAVAEFEYQENEYEEDEGESAYYLPGAFEGRKGSKFAQKKRKNPKIYTPRSCEVEGDFLYGHCKENRIGIPQSSARRPPNGLSVCPIPAKRVRTASRQRIVGPFTSGGIMPVPSRTDASSGDTNSFQDDQSTLHGSLILRGVEVESGMDYDKQSAFDSAETIAKPKKKKKTKHQGTTYDQRWQVDYSMQIEQRDHFKRRLENHQFDSNGYSGTFGPHSKKPKIMKQTFDNSFENTTPISGSVASPVGSQMSNMSNPNKLMKLIGGRDRGRKTKSLKMPSGQTGSGSPWSLFEDQALVVLVHDMGPNWELVSDAVNSTLHFKCIFRKPKECKERHGILMEKSCGDGADTEDSGSSQSYPSTLRGIPKGGARQLFQQLRGPLEEDTIKSHFEKIILIGQQLHGRKKQESKQLVPVHSSHLAAVSQVIPNYVDGGVLTPLDLCDMVASSPDVFSLGYQGPHTGGLPLANQGAVQSMLPSSSTNSSLQGSPSMGLGSNLASPSAQLSDPVRDGRYGVPRTSVQIDEQHRIQQYNHMLSNRNIQQPSIPVPGIFSGNDRGGRMLPGGNGMVMPGMSRSMSMPRPVHQGISSPSMLNSGSMAASNMVGMPSSMSMHSGGNAGQGNTMLRARDALHMTLNPEHHGQMMSSEMQMQVSHANSQGAPAFGGLSSKFPSQSASSLPTYPVHHQQQHSNTPSNSHHLHLQGSAHPGSTEQQAFALRLARQRQLHQRMLQRRQQQQQHQQFPASSALLTHVSTQSQLSISTALPNSSQTQLQAACQPVSLPPVTPSSAMAPVTAQQQKKHQLPQSGAGGMINQGGKQRQRQGQQLQPQLPQSDRHHLPQQQPCQSQQHAKHLKGMGRGNLLTHQNLPVDSSHPTQSSKPVVPPSAQSHPQQKLYSNSVPGLSKQVQQMHSHPDSDNTSQAPALTSAPTVPASNQGIPPPVIQSPSHQQLKVHSHPPTKLVNHTQPTIHRAISHNHVTNSDPVAKTQNDQSQAEQQLANNSLPMSTTSGIPPVACSAGSAGGKSSESLSDMIIPNPQLGPTGSPMTNSSGNGAPAGQGLGLKQPSNSSGSHGSLQQKQQQQLQTTAPNQVLVLKKHQSQQQQLLEQTSQRQPVLRQHPQPQVQAAQSNTFARSSNSSLE